MRGQPLVSMVGMAADSELDQSDHTVRWFAAFRKLGNVVSTPSVRAARREVAQTKGDPVLDEEELIENAVADTTNFYLREEAAFKIRDIQSTTKAFVRQQIALGEEAGEGIEKIARRIRGGPITNRRARVIARTEVIAATNRGQMAGAQSMGIPLQKEWLAADQPGRTRDTHAAASGQTREMKEPFSVGGAQLMQPGDTSLGAPPEETINCRCTVIFKRPR